MTGFLREIVDLVLPAECAGCGRTRAGSWCERCRARLGGVAAVRRVIPDPVPPGLPAVYAAGAYEDELRAALLAHKERGALRLAHPLGEALAGAVGVAWTASASASAPASTSDPASASASASAGAGTGAGMEAGAALAARDAGPLLLVPVPSARRATAARGHDPLRRIGSRAAGELRRAGWAVRMVPVLRQRRVVADQSRLPAAERLVNLAGALGVVRGAERLLAAGPVVVVDDLVTTGASLAEAARAVAAAGGRVLGAAVVAASPGSYGTGCSEASAQMGAVIRNSNGGRRRQGVPRATHEGYVQL